MKSHYFFSFSAFNSIGVQNPILSIDWEYTFLFLNLHPLELWEWLNNSGGGPHHDQGKVLRTQCYRLDT